MATEGTMTMGTDQQPKRELYVKQSQSDSLNFYAFCQC